MQFIDLSKQLVYIREKINSRIQKVLDHGQFILGKEVFELEDLLAKYVNKKHCISCSSGTDALLIPLMAKNIGPGDAVITSPFTYIATAEVIAMLGATPVFADIYEQTFNINPENIEEAIAFAKKKKLKPKAIIPVDIFGLPARYRMIKEIAKKYKLFLIEDFAQAFGSKIGKKRAGSFGDVSSTSFYPAKPLGCYGDGGAIFTDDDKLADLMRSIRVHGGGKNKYQNIRIGLNGRLDTIQAAILLEKFKVFESELISRNKIANYYKKNINAQLIKPYIPKNYLSSWAQFSILAKNEKDRKSILEKLSINKIPYAIFYEIPLHLQKVFSYLNYKKNSFPIATDISKRIFSIPMHPYLSKREQNIIVEVLNN